jgi:hypothetical protein
MAKSNKEILKNTHNIVNSMPKAKKAKWLEALRTGKYQQGHGRLKSGEGYCCLGVLQMCLTDKVEIHQDSKFLSLTFPSINWLKNQDINFMKTYGDLESEWPLNDEPTFLVNGQLRTASDLNDIARFSFKKIARLIETQVEGV